MSDHKETKAEHAADPQGRLEALVSGCDICREPREIGELKHLPIYVHGSEGINLCDICQQALTDHLQAMRCAANRAHKRGWLAGKMIATAAGR